MNRIAASAILALSLFSASTAWASHCPKLYAQCVVIANGICNTQGTTFVDSCWKWLALECEPCARADDECNSAFPSCNGNCVALSTDQFKAECNDVALRGVSPAMARNGRYMRLKADELRMMQIHEQQLAQKLDLGEAKYLRQRQAYELRLLRKMQADVLRSGR